MRKVVPCSTVKHEKKIAHAKQLDKIFVEIPLSVLPDGGREDLIYWWVEAFDKALIDWKSGTIKLEYTAFHYLPEYMRDMEEESTVVFEENLPKTAPTYLLKELNAGAENQVIPENATLEALCHRCGLTHLQTMIYLCEDWSSDDDIGDMIYNYYN